MLVTALPHLAPFPLPSVSLQLVALVYKAGSLGAQETPDPAPSLQSHILLRPWGWYLPLVQDKL